MKYHLRINKTFRNIFRAACGQTRYRDDPTSSRIVPPDEWPLLPSIVEKCANCTKAAPYWIARAESGDLPG